MKKKKFKGMKYLYEGNMCIIITLIMSIFSFYPLDTIAQSDKGENQQNAPTTLFFYYKPYGKILLRNYKSNNSMYTRLASLIREHKKDIVSGNSHFAITAYIPFSERRNMKEVNYRSMQANVIRSLVKSREFLSSKHFTFHFDTDYVKKRVICVKYIPYRIIKGSNQLVSYTLHDNQQYLYQAFHKYIARYGRIPLAEDEKIITGVMTVDTNKVNKREVLGDSIFVKDSFPVHHISQSVPAGSQDFNIVNHSPVKEMFSPLLGIKTNLLYWVGITSEFRRRDMIPNLELEFYTCSKISLNTDISYIYMNKGDSKPSKKVWGVSNIGIEPRIWFHRDFSGVYVGIYGLYGQMDVKLGNENQVGHTGNLYEGGISLGYALHLSNHWGLEFGSRFGSRSVNGDTYDYSSSHYYKQSSFTQYGLKVTGLRLLLVYRLGRTVNIKSKK
jgi:hypothetical protein